VSLVVYIVSLNDCLNDYRYPAKDNPNALLPVLSVVTFCVDHDRLSFPTMACIPSEGGVCHPMALAWVRRVRSWTSDIIGWEVLGAVASCSKLRSMYHALRQRAVRLQLVDLEEISLGYYPHEEDTLEDIGETEVVVRYWMDFLETQGGSLSRKVLRNLRTRMNVLRWWEGKTFLLYDTPRFVESPENATFFWRRWMDDIHGWVMLLRGCKAGGGRAKLLVDLQCRAMRYCRAHMDELKGGEAVRYDFSAAVASPLTVAAVAHR
jgi:hypothetical protein